MTQTELIATAKRAMRERDELGSRLTHMVNAMYTQGQVACSMLFDAGRRITELENEVARYQAQQAELMKLYPADTNGDSGIVEGIKAALDNAKSYCDGCGTG